MLTRREVLFGLGAAVAFRNTALDLVETAVSKLGNSPLATAEDEDFWLSVREAFALDPNIVNFNNGGCSPSPRIVADSLRRQQEFANQAPSYFMWRQLEAEIEGVRSRLATMF